MPTASLPAGGLALVRIALLSSASREPGPHIPCPQGPGLADWEAWSPALTSLLKRESASVGNSEAGPGIQQQAPAWEVRAPPFFQPCHPTEQED